MKNVFFVFLVYEWVCTVIDFSSGGELVFIFFMYGCLTYSESEAIVVLEIGLRRVASVCTDYRFVCEIICVWRAGGSIVYLVTFHFQL